MNTFKFENYSDLPIDLVETFKVDIPAKTQTFFDIDVNTFVQVFEDGTALYVNRSESKYSIKSNKKFNQTIAGGSRHLIISFVE